GATMSRSCAESMGRLSGGLFSFIFFKQKTAYEMADWSSDVCSSDLGTFELTSLQFSPLQRFSKLRVPPPCCSDSIAYVRSGGRCAGQSAPVRPQLCNQLCNSRPTTAYNYDVLAHTSGQHPAHEFQDLFERFLRMDAARSFD